MQQFDKSCYRTSKYVAHAYFESLRSRRVVRQWRRTAKPTYDESLLAAFIELLQAPIDKMGADRYYHRLLRDVVVPEAKRLKISTSPFTLRDALGVKDKSTFFAFCSSLLFLRNTGDKQCDTDTIKEIADDQSYERLTAPIIARHFDDCWKHLPATLKQDIQQARRRQLARLRFYLMTNTNLRFLAGAKLKAAHDENIDPTGYGASRIGVYGYSHVGREIVFLALLDELVGGGLLEAIEHIDPTVRAITPVNDGDEDVELTALFDYVLVPISQALFHLIEKSETWSPDVAKRQYEMQLENATESMLISSEQFNPSERDVGSLAQLNTEQCSGSVGPLENDKKRDFARSSRPMFEADPLTDSLYRAVLRVIKFLQSGDNGANNNGKKITNVIAYGDERASLEEVFRLWFALQLLSLLNRKRYTAGDPVQLICDLEEIFKEQGDESTGDALAVVKQVRSRKQIFGEKFVDARKQVVKLSVSGSSIAVKFEMHRDAVREHLNELSKYEGIIGPMPRLDGENAISLVALAAWIAERLSHIDTHTSLVTPGACAALESLFRSLQVFFENYPCHYCREGIAEVENLQVLSPDINAHNDRTLSNIRNEVIELQRRLEDDGISRNNDQFYAYFLSTIVIELINDCLVSTNREASSTDIKEVLRFFSMKYAKTQSKYEQEQWLYVAFKLSLTEGLEVYRQIFERVSHHVGEWGVDSVDFSEDEVHDDNISEETTTLGNKPKRQTLRLSILYQDLLALECFQQDIIEPLEAMFSVPGDGL